MALKSHIAKVFNRSQQSAADHPKLIKLLKAEYEKSDSSEFLEYFIDCFKYALIHGERETAVNLSLDFAAKFATTFENENARDDPEAACHPFYEGLFEFLLANHNVKGVAVRFRVCQFINRLLEELSESASINADLFEKIYDAMLERIQDRIACVRVQAVVAMQRLQDPTNKECPVIKALAFHLERDPHPEVRKAVLKALGCNYFTLDFVVKRLRDVKDTVRRQAYIFISERVHVRSLSIANRVTILKLGLNDRSDLVKTVVQDKVIPAWINAMEGSLFSLLRGLDVEGCSDLAVQILNVWFKTLNYKEITSLLPIKEDHLVDVESLKPEVALYWRTAIQFLRKEGVHAADELDNIQPEMTAFGKYVKSYVIAQLNQTDDMAQILSMEFIVGQLLQMAPCFDLADEAGRLNLSRDLCDLLQLEKTSPVLTRSMVKCISLIEPRLEVRIIKLLEVISELREPLTQVEIPISEEQQRKNKLEIAQCRVRLNEFKDDLETAVHDQNFTEAQEIKKKIAEVESKLNSINEKSTVPETEPIREERDDPLTLLKCLSIVCELLKNAPMLKLTKELDQLLTSLILPCVERVDPAVRNAAFEALGSLCTCDLELAQQRLLLFVQAVQMDHTVLQVTTAKVLFDLVHLFGLPSFEDKETGLSLASILTDLLDSEDADVQTVAVEGFAKLLISSRVESTMVLSRLVIFLFHPLTQDNVRLRQVLNVFFPFFASTALIHQHQLEAAFLPTLKTIQRAPVTSPLAEMDISMIVKLFVDLTQESLLMKKVEADHDIHDQLAMKLCTEALRSPDTAEGKVYLKALLQLNPSFGNPSHTKDLCELTRKLQRKWKDKHGLKAIAQFDTYARKHLANQETEDSAGETTQDETNATAAETTNGSQQQQERPRIKKLGSKIGTTLLMDLTGGTGSDAEMSQSSDTFCSPASNNSNRMVLKKTANISPVTSEEMEIEIDSSSAAGSDHADPPRRTRSSLRKNSSAVVPTPSSKNDRNKDIEDSDDDFVPPTPPQRSTRSRRGAASKN